MNRMHHIWKKDRFISADTTANHNKSAHQTGLDGGVKEEVTATLDGKGDGLPKQCVPDVIVIEDDGSSEVENYDGDAFITRSQSHYHTSSRGDSLNGSSFDTSKLSNSSDEEDCVVLEPHATGGTSFLDRRFSKSRKRPRLPGGAMPDTNKKMSSPSSSSDCEIVLDSDGKARQDWEEAALKRRTRKAMFRAESEESTSVSNHTISDSGNSAKKRRRDDVQSHVRSDQQNGPNFSALGVGLDLGKEKREDATTFDQQDSNLDVLDVRSDDSNEEASSAADLLKRSGNVEGENTMPVELRHSVHDGVPPHSDDMETSGRLNDTLTKSNQGTEIRVVLPSADNLFTDRELLKQSTEFRHADEEEWARRHKELRKQAEEVQRERKRRKIEAERKREMEARQRQRLEEIRQSQLKEEQASGFKEKVRDRIRLDLEHIATTCRDMATLLRQLGIPVEGGPLATNQQVTAAYKKALFRFHPDRAAASAKSDPRDQVEAEEKFKLVSRMKGVLPLVSSSYFR